MAEYYPLLAKAVGSLPNSTPESRRVVYERARKALIGQLRTLHPPVPEEDIDRESVALDQAVQRLEGELADGGVPPAAAALVAPASPPRAAAPPAPRARPASVLPEAPLAGSKTADTPAPLLRTRLPTPRRPASAQPNSVAPNESLAESGGAPPPTSVVLPSASHAEELGASGAGRPAIDPSEPPRVRGEVQRPIAPQPQGAGAPKRRVWIMFAGIGIVVVLVAAAAFKLRESRETVTRRPVAEKTTPADSGKIAQRVGGDTGEAQPAGGPSPTSSSPPAPAVPITAAPPAADNAAPNNPEVPVAYRAALLVEAPTETNKVKTFLGTVTWKLTNVGNGPSEAVGTAVEADIELPDDKMKATVTFEKNTDASLPASHTVRVRFSMQSGSFTGDVQQISVPQLRQEDSPGGDALAGVTVPVLPNSFLIGLSPGTAEAINLKQIKDQQWIDIPMLLSSGKIAKLTFEKGDAGTRDLNEAIAAWSKP